MKDITPNIFNWFIDGIAEANIMRSLAFVIMLSMIITTIYFELIILVSRFVISKQ